MNGTINETAQNVPEIDFDGICDTAIQYAKAFHKSFDYSASSIQELEEILQFYYEESQASPLTDGHLWNLSVIWGVYLGQSLLKNGLEAQGYAWIMDDGTPVLTKNSANSMSPVTKVYKRLQNGPEDNVKSFYDIALLIAAGKFNLTGKR